MKNKVFSLLAVVMFVGSSLNATNVEYKSELVPQNCSAYAEVAAQAEMDCYYSTFHQYFLPPSIEYAAYNYYLGYCDAVNANGGTALTPACI